MARRSVSSEASSSLTRGSGCMTLASRIFRLAEEFGVDLRVGPLLLGPALLLEAGDVDRVDLLLQDQAVVDFRLGIERKLMRLVGGDVERVDRAAVGLPGALEIIRQ